MTRPGHAPRRGRASRITLARSVLAIDATRALALPGRHGGDHRGRRPRRALLRAPLQRLAPVHRDRRGDSTASAMSSPPSPRPTCGRRARACELVQIDYEVLAPLIEAEKAARARTRRRSATHGNLLSETRDQARRRRGGARQSAHVVSRDLADAAHRARSSSSPSACLADHLPTGGIKLSPQGQGIFDDRRQCASFLGVSRGGPRGRARPERRRLRRQGGHVDPGADGAPRAA